MEQYVSKSTLVAEIKKRIDEHNSLANAAADNNLHNTLEANELLIRSYKNLMSFIDTLEVKEVDLDNITGWFDHIAQIADDRMTLTGQRMTDAHSLDEIKCLAKDSSAFITKYYKAQKGE